MSGSTCGATTRSGAPCQREAGWGTDHGPRDGQPGFGRCKNHTGSTTNGRKDATLQRARWEAGRLGGPMTDLEPHDALVLCFQMKAAEVDFYSGKLAELDSDDDVVASAYLRGREVATKDMATFAKAAADAGVDERRLRLTERYAEPLAAVLNAIMAGLVDAGMDRSFLPVARSLFDQHAGLLDQTVDGTATVVSPMGDMPTLPMGKPSTEVGPTVPTETLPMGNTEAGT